SRSSTERARAPGLVSASSEPASRLRPTPSSRVRTAEVKVRSAKAAMSAKGLQCLNCSEKYLKIINGRLSQTFTEVTPFGLEGPRPAAWGEIVAGAWPTIPANAATEARQ